MILVLAYYPIAIAVFVWGIFQPFWAGAVWTASCLCFSVYCFSMDILGRPRVDDVDCTREEARAIKSYHLHLRYPLGARMFSNLLGSFRWSAVIWIPWLLWSHLWIPAVLLGINFLATGDLWLRLDPVFIYTEGVKNSTGKLAAFYARELELIEWVRARHF